MTRQLLFYEQATSVSRRRHARAAVDMVRDYGFAANVNSVPLMAVEFARSALHYPIVFTGQDEALTPVAVLGLEGHRNAFVTADGHWRAEYRPAFVRRYPFVFASGDHGTTFTLCIDEHFEGFNQAGRGRRLFDDGGEPSEYLNRVLEFLKLYQVQHRRTRAFCAKLQALDLLEPMQAQITASSGRGRSLGGFQAVNRERLKALETDALSAMLQADELELVFAHLQSMQNFERLPRSNSEPVDGEVGEAVAVD